MVENWHDSGKKVWARNRGKREQGVSVKRLKQKGSISRETGRGVQEELLDLFKI